MNNPEGKMDFPRARYDWAMSFSTPFKGLALTGIARADRIDGDINQGQRAIGRHDAEHLSPQ
jgi:hypothetical protein